MKRNSRVSSIRTILEESNSRIYSSISNFTFSRSSHSLSRSSNTLSIFSSAFSIIPSLYAKSNVNNDSNLSDDFDFIESDISLTIGTLQDEDVNIKEK